ncbi:MAG: signal peptide peptidase SppA [Candidatus Eisenbacteria bacterium]|nr:signal peptide peptidase SppA [Candidatus Eisenbacteria bacterium]
MTRKGCVWGWLIGVLAVLVVFLVTIAAIESLLGQRVSFPSYGARVGLVRVEGAVYDARRIIADLENMSTDPGIRAIVLRIDSPGGGAAAAQEIYEYLLGIKESGTPIVASMGSVAASGGYYIACTADTIVANPASLTGSIGVIMSFSNLEELFDKLGMDFSVIKSGEFKDTGSWSREMTQDERALLQATVDDIHAQFVEAVSASRGMTIENVAALADGRVFSGRQAVAQGLVDRLGTLEDAIEIAGRMGEIHGTPRVQEPVRRERLTLLDLLTSAATNVLGPESGYSGAHFIYRPSK